MQAVQVGQGRRDRCRQPRYASQHAEGTQAGEAGQVASAWHRYRLVDAGFPPRSLSLQIVQPNQQGGKTFDSWGYPANYNDDLVQTWLGIGPQIDGLGHLGEAGLYYNCNNEKDFAGITGLTKLGVDKIPPLVGRGVLIDMAKHLGKDHLAAGENFGSAEIKAAAAA